jgi:hypothetical protein
MMSERLSTRFRTFVILATVLLVSLLALPIGQCAGEMTGPERRAYYRAMKDSEKATPDEVCRELLAVIPGMDRVNAEKLRYYKIKWEGEEGKSRILVGAFMTKDDFVKWGYQENLKQHQEAYSLTGSLWVTVVPELRNRFMGEESCPPSRHRIEKLLGLNSDYKKYEVIVEMWVNPRDLFRPSADPEITDHESEPANKNDADVWEFPVEKNPFIRYSAKQYIAYKGATPKSFKQWYSDNAASSYKADPATPVAQWGVPWTRLGYTYDWGNPGDPVGLSEFIIRLNPRKGQITVKLHDAIRAYDEPDNPSNWDGYFRCQFGQDAQEVNWDAWSAFHIQPN